MLLQSSLYYHSPIVALLIAVVRLSLLLKSPCNTPCDGAKRGIIKGSIILILFPALSIKQDAEVRFNHCRNTFSPLLSQALRCLFYFFVDT